MAENNWSSTNYELINAKATSVSLAVVLAATIGMMLSVNYLEGWEQGAINALASSILSIGLVSFLYGIFLRRAIGRELLKLVGIEKSIAANAISRAGEASDLDWSSVLSKVSVLKVLISDPASWIDANWSRILNTGKERAIHIDLFFPDPEWEGFHYIASFLSLDEEDLKNSINRAQKVVEDSWKLSADNKSLKSGSKIRISLIKIFPAYTLLKSEKIAIIILTNSTGKIPADVGFYLMFEGPDSDYPMNWFKKTVERVESTPATYENLVGGDS